MSFLAFVGWNQLHLNSMIWLQPVSKLVEALEALKMGFMSFPEFDPMFALTCTGSAAES